MFKTDIDLSNIQDSPYVYHDTEGHFQWDFWNYATTEHVTFIFEDTNYPDVAAEHFPRGRSSRRDHVDPGAARRLRARAARRRVGTDRRRRHLPGLPRPTDAALPAAFADRDPPRPEGLVLGADPRVPVVHDPVRDVASHGVLQDDSPGARGRRARRRLLEAEGVLPDRSPGFAAGHPHRRHLRVLPLRERVHLRVHVHLLLGAANRLGRSTRTTSFAGTSSSGSRSSRRRSFRRYRSRSSTTRSSIGS